MWTLPGRTEQELEPAKRKSQQEEVKNEQKSRTDSSELYGEDMKRFLRG